MQWRTLKNTFYINISSAKTFLKNPTANVSLHTPSMLSIIFQRDGRTDWWKPNQTSLPPPRGLEQPSDGVKNERPTGVYLKTTIHGKTAVCMCRRIKLPLYGTEGQYNKAINLIEGKCLMTTSRAWMVSKGMFGSRPESASCRACRLTHDTHFIATLKLLSFPSPGIVTSSST